MEFWMEDMEQSEENSGLKALIPIKELESMEEDLEFRLTPALVKEWSSHLNPNDFYLDPVLWIYVYVDLSRACIMDTNISSDLECLEEYLPMFRSVMWQIEMTLEQCEAYLKQKRYGLLTSICPQRFRLELLIALIEEQEPSEHLYRDFVRTYRSSDFGFEKLDASFWSQLPTTLKGRGL